jgi:hypothetical protein
MAKAAAGKGKHFDPGHGRLMKEWIAVEAGAARGSRSSRWRSRDGEQSLGWSAVVDAFLSAHSEM